VENFHVAHLTDAKKNYFPFLSSDCLSRFKFVWFRLSFLLPTRVFLGSWVAVFVFMILFLFNPWQLEACLSIKFLTPLLHLHRFLWKWLSVYFSLFSFSSTSHVNSIGFSAVEWKKANNQDFSSQDNKYKYLSRFTADKVKYSKSIAHRVRCT